MPKQGGCRILKANPSFFRQIEKHESLPAHLLYLLCCWQVEREAMIQFGRQGHGSALPVFEWGYGRVSYLYQKSRGHRARLLGIPFMLT